MKLEGKVAAVAGGGQGIGEGIIRCLAEEGADIAVVDINKDIAAKVSDDVKGMGRKALPVIADLTSEEDVNTAVREIVDFFGKIDILVNNVGGVSPEMGQMMQDHIESLNDDTLPSYMRYSADVWDKFFYLNLKSHVMMSQAVTPYFVKQHSGKIVNISSISGRMPDPNQMPYSAFKAGDINITWALARGLAEHNVNVNCVCPGFVYTPLWDRGATGYLTMLKEIKSGKRSVPTNMKRFAEIDADPEKLTPYEFWINYIVKPSTPMGREQSAEDMGKAVLFLVSEDAKNITGQTIHVDGGIVMR